MPTSIQKSLSSSLESLRSMLAAVLGHFLDETGRTDDVLEPSLLLKFLDDPRGHKFSPIACLSSLWKKRLPGRVRDSSHWSQGPHLFGVLPSPRTSHCMLPSLLRKWLRNACDEKRKSFIHTILVRSPQSNVKI